jgi:hypothetical protein
MLTLLLLTAVSGWNYDGFVAEPDEPKSSARREDPWNGDPAPTRLPAPVRLPASPTADTTKGTLSNTSRGRSGVRDEPAKKTTAVQEIGPTGRAAAPLTPVVPTVWRLSDSSGQAWDHVDPTWLARWVESRNAELARQRVAVAAYPTVYRGAPVCTTGRCPKTR